MTPQRAVLLLRISYRKPEDGEEETDETARRREFSKGIGRQEEDGRALAARLGWTVAKVIPEDDTSAFKRRRIKLPDGSTALRTVRPGFREALEGLADGTYDGMIADDLDRVARDPRDLEDLIDVVESSRPRIPVTSVTGSLRLDDDAGVTMARVMVAVANKSSRDTARRVTRKHEELAAEGKPPGGGYRGYGFTAAGHEPIEEEAEILREIAARILGDWDGWTPEQRAQVDPELGESLNSIAADLRRRNVPTVTGALWADRSVRSVISKPSVAGLREYRGEVVGKAVWPAIVPEDRWEEVRARLAGRHRSVDVRLQRWLTGVLRCSRCGLMLHGWQGNNGPRYWCAKPRGGCGKIAVKAAFAEDEVQRQVLELLGREDVLRQLRTVADTEVTDEVRAELAADEAQLKELAGAYARRQLTFPEYREARGIIEQRIKESRALLTSRAPRVLRRLLAAEDVAGGWSELTPPDRREVVLALVPGYDVLPHDRSMGNRFDPGRLVPFEA
ncbi:recombinase family protein [Streptomyces sp. C1-2]|uniref:recombinase family protein n=1 Tax=Streptomyces sp. C1-2 TaxID=2720022 RepID=UPI0014323E7C|nr:recombinase family protein [Streptomyces sp. C1-2]NJP72474.1 recombinase family protein [Streptomyces sp. C1-2]